MRTITVVMARHTKDGYTLSPQTRDVELLRIVADAKGSNPKDGVWFPGAGAVYLSVNSGWGEKPIAMYRISEADLAGLREEAKLLTFKVRTVDSAPNPKRRGTTRPKDAGPAVKQISLFEVQK